MGGVVGVMIYYQESPTWLTTAISSTAPALDALVAVDGGFVLFPGATEKPASTFECHAAVYEACRVAGLPLIHHIPSEPFYENEVGKRNFSLDLAYTVATDDTWWILVFDADQVGRNVTPKVKEILAASEHIVGEYARFDGLDVQMMVDKHGLDKHQTYQPEGFTSVRGLYRAVPGLRYGPAHWNLSAPTSDGKVIWLWGNSHLHKPYVHEYEDMTDWLKFDHRNPSRDYARIKRAEEYYKLRDLTKIEIQAKLHMRGIDGKSTILRP